jgi:hypothetical protein
MGVRGVWVAMDSEEGGEKSGAVSESKMQEKAKN